MKFWDSSAIAPLCVREARSTQLRALAEDDTSLVAAGKRDPEALSPAQYWGPRPR
ncbi:MAG: hypothetical protein HYV08_03815 [Deltaproteobacteria bacterium]|nr:hypothetical protein [Deltaproteobacteria bacterium]